MTRFKHITRHLLSFRNRIVAIVAGVTLVALSLLFTNQMAGQLKEKEQHEVEPVSYTHLTLPTILRV